MQRTEPLVAARPSGRAPLFRSLRARLIGASLAVTALAMAVVGVAAGVSTSRDLTQTAGNTLRNQANAEAQVVSGILERQIVSLRAFGLSEVLVYSITSANSLYNGDEAAATARVREIDARWPSLADDDPMMFRVLASPLADQFRTYNASYPDNVEVMVTDRYGALVAASARTSDYDQSDEEWWQRAWNGGDGALYISQPVYDESSKAHALIMALPVVNHSDGKPIGVLRVTYRLDSLVNQVNAIRIGESGRGHVLLPDGHMLDARPGAARLDDGLLSRLSAAAQAPYTEAALGGATNFLSAAPIDGEPAVTALGWRALLYQRRDEALQPVAAATRASLSTILGVLLLATIPAAMLAQWISAPIQRMNDAARRIAAGDLSQRLVLRTGGEIGQLAQSFDSMAAALEQRIAAEQAAQDERLRLQEDMIRLQQATLEELSTPLIPLSDRLLLMPLIGSIDTHRADQVLHTLLEGVAARHAEAVLLDLTGVRTVDTAVARGLLRAVQGVRMLGAEIALIGIRPDVAQTLVSLGVDLGQVTIYANLRAAMADGRW